MHEKGQVFTVDFIISISIVMLALGIGLQLNELNFYASNEDESYARLESIGRVASDLLVMHPKLNCPVVSITDDSNIDHLPNTWCVTKVKAEFQSDLTVEPITERDLGIPGKYRCRLEIDPDTYTIETTLDLGTVDFCRDSLPLLEDTNYMFTSDRIILLANDNDVKESEVWNCRIGGGGCVFSKAVLTLHVWRDGG